MKEFFIGENDAGQTVARFIGKAAKNLPKSLFYKALRQKDIKRNGRRCQAADLLQKGDRLTVYLNDDFFALPDDRASRGADDFLLAPADLSVRYEDQNLLIADKPPGLIVHADKGSGSDTLINRIKHYLFLKGDYRPDRENTFVPALCNRLDRNTGGLVIAAKNAQTLRIINQKIKNREISKRYLCLVQGAPPANADTLEGFLYKDQRTNTVSVSDTPASGAKPIKTGYRVVRRFPDHTLLEIDLFSGRSHQIRAHMAHIGCPIAGDIKYGGRQIPGRYQALYAYCLRFAFQTDAGALSYLNETVVKAEQVWFENGLDLK